MARPATAAVRLLTGEREPVRLATTANISLYGLQTIDAVLTEVGDRVLVKDQSDGSQNGIYTTSAGNWYRAADARSSRTMQKGTTVHVQDGTANGSKVFCFQTEAPAVGTDAISITLYLSENTLGDAQTAATNAANSASAASTSATSAGTSATNAANSATAGNTSKNNAATSETNAGNSATAASTSAGNAATSATNAGNSATSAATSATNAGNSATAASGSATTASTAATNAGNSATAAAASATAAANAAQAMPYTFSTTTADADPGNGIFRLNNATIASATAAYVDNQDSDGTGQTGNLDTFDDSTNTVKGKLTIRSRTTAATKHVFNVTGSVVDGTGYRKLTLAYVGGAGVLANAEGCWLEFARSGDKGADGAGAGDFIGPASSVTDNIVTFAGTTGKAGKDSGVAVSSLAPKASPALTGTPTAPTATAGTNSTQIATTAYVDTTFAPKAGPTFTGTPAAPTATPGTNTTQIATTAFVTAAISALSSVYQTASSVLTALAGIGTAVAGDIIYATGAGAWGRLAKGAASQALLMNSGATAPQWSTLPFTKSFQSAQQTITSAGSLTLAHGLGTKPGALMTSLVCVTAEAGYSVGDEVFVSQAAQSLVPDATNINVRFGSTAGTSYSVMHKTTGVTPTGITNANWQFVVRAWA